MTVAQAIDPSGTATTQFTDADGLNPRNSPPYEDGYVVHTFSATTAGQKLRVTEGGNVEVLRCGAGGGGAKGNSAGGGEGGGVSYSATVALLVNDYSIIVGKLGGRAETDGTNGSKGGDSYFIGGTALGGLGGLANAAGNATQVGGGGLGGAGGDFDTDGTAATGTNGGDGYTSTITGTTDYYGPGGGGWSCQENNRTVGGNNLNAPVSTATEKGQGGFRDIGPTSDLADYRTAGHGYSRGGGAGGGGLDILSGAVAAHGADGVIIIRYAYVEPSSIPAVTTQVATDVTSTGATLNGNLTDLAGMEEVEVFFWLAETGEVFSASPAPLQTAISTGTFSATISGLTPETTYDFAAAVSDGTTNWEGSRLSFTTTAASTTPVVTSTSQFGSPTTATLLGKMNDMGGYASLSCYFEYGLTESFGTTTTPETISEINDLFTAGLTGLTPETRYYFRSVATDGTSFWYSSTKSLFTGQEGDVFYEIEYGPTDEGHETVSGTAGATDSNTTTTKNVGEDTFYDQTDVPESTLNRARVRYYDGSAFSDWSDWLEVGTLSPSGMTVVTTACTAVVSDGATLNGNLTNMGGHAAVDVYFRVMLKSGDTYVLVEETTAAEVTATGAFSASITDLERATTYSIFAVAAKDAEIVIGNEIILVTDGLIVNTLNASSIGTTTATLNGELVSLNEEVSLDVYFEYGLNFENSTADQTKSALGSFSQAITGLEARTEYVFRAVATDGTNIWYGEAFTFTTTFDAVVITFYPSSVTKISATLEGSINMSLAEADYYFEYGFTTAYGLTTTPTAITETDGPEAVDADITELTEDTTYHCRLVLLDGTTYYYGNDIVFQTATTKTVTSNREGLWLFDADEDTKHWSTMAQTYGGVTYTAAVVPNSFRGIESQVSLGNGLISSSDLTFDLFFDDSTTVTNYLESLEGTDLLITLVTGEGIDAEVSKQWQFIIERAIFSYGIIRCYCKSILQSCLTGDWPNSENPQEIWPSSDPDSYPEYCVPVIFGTAYIPIKSVNTGEGTAPFNTRKYVLGPDGPTYDVEKIKAPRERGSSTWASGDYTFTQSSHNDYRLCEFIIADSDLDGTADANGIWIQGATVQIPFVKYSRSDTENKTNPADWIEHILRDIGVKSSYIDTGTGSTFAAAKRLFDNRGLIWGGGFWEKRPRETVLADLLSMCDAYLYESDKIELHVFATSSHEYFDKTLERTFSVNPTLVTQNDGGGVEWPALDDPQDVFPGKTNINVDPFEDGVDNPTKSPFRYRFQYGTVIPQKAAILHYQKQHTKNRVSFSSSVLDIHNLNTLIPGKVVTLYNPKVFRLLKGIIITSMMVNYDLTVDFSAVELTYMNQWDDLDPDPVTIVEDETEDTMA